MRIHGGANYKYENSAYIRTKFHILSRHVSGIQNKLEKKQIRNISWDCPFKVSFQEYNTDSNKFFRGIYIYSMYIYMYVITMRGFAHCTVHLKKKANFNWCWLYISPVSRDPSSAVFDKLGNLSTMWNDSGFFAAYGPAVKPLSRETVIFFVARFPDVCILLLLFFLSSWTLSSSEGVDLQLVDQHSVSQRLVQI